MKIFIKNSNQLFTIIVRVRMVQLEFLYDLITSFDVISITIPYLALTYVHDLDW